MDKYVINDLYLAAFLRARGYECKIEAKTFNKFCFVFPKEAKQEVEDYISQWNTFNVNASKLINEVKTLKSYISNNI